MKHLGGDEDLIISGSGLVAKGLDRSTEHSISVLDWTEASAVAAGRIRAHHGDVYGDAWVKHNSNVVKVAGSHKWPVAVRYDIQQHEAASSDWTHDIALLDTNSVGLISSAYILHLQQVAWDSPTSTETGSKRTSSDVYSAPAAKHARPSEGSLCFRCGHIGHLPKDCSATVSKAGKPVAALAATSRALNGLAGPNGSPFCFRWSSESKCKFGASCTFHHGCSLCSSPSHGARSCSYL